MRKRLEGKFRTPLGFCYAGEDNRRRRMERIHVAVRSRPLSTEEAKTSPWKISSDSIFMPNHSTLSFEFGTFLSSFPSPSALVIFMLNLSLLPQQIGFSEKIAKLCKSMKLGRRISSLPPFADSTVILSKYSNRFSWSTLLFDLVYFDFDNLSSLWLFDSILMKMKLSSLQLCWVSVSFWLNQQFLESV